MGSFSSKPETTQYGPYQSDRRGVADLLPKKKSVAGNRTMVNTQFRGAVGPTAKKISPNQQDGAGKKKTNSDGTTRAETRDPIMKVHEICVARKLNKPRFEYEMEVTPTGKSIAHKFTVQCHVQGDDRAFWAKGVAGKKMEAKRIAAMEVYKQIVGQQPDENVVGRTAAAAATCGFPTSSRKSVSPNGYLAGQQQSEHTAPANRKESDEIHRQVVNNRKHDEVAVYRRTTDAGRVQTGSEVTTKPPKPVISKLYELCVASKYSCPRFEYDMIVNHTPKSTSHTFKACCFVMVGSEMQFMAEGVAGTKMAAKKLAAEMVYSQLTE